MKRCMIFAVLMTGPAYGADEVMQACTSLQAVSISAIKNQAGGLEQSQMRASLPPLSVLDGDTPRPQTELLTSMHEILDEIYAFPTLNPQIYSIYRMEKCFRRMTDQEVPQDFTEVAPKLEACASEEEGQVECAMRAAGSSPDQQ
jgi:hypothetical protein